MTQIEHGGEHSANVDVAITNVMAIWAELSEDDWRNILHLSIEELTMEELDGLDDNITLLYFLM